MTNFIVTEAAMRPASDKPQCFYCHQAIGGMHKNSCVLVIKRIKIRATVEYEVHVPADWDKEQIEFQRNESSWCADNLIKELKVFRNSIDEESCLCPVTSFDYLTDVSGPMLDES